MKRSILFTALACSVFTVTSIDAQTVATDPVGFVQPFIATGGSGPNMLANSDTIVSLPFIRPPEFIGAVTAASANTLTVSGSPWSASQFVYNAGSNQHNVYFALIGPHSSTNPKEGRIYQITANTSNQLTLAVGGDDLSTVAANTQIVIAPYHSLISVFPASDVGVSFINSPNAVNRPTQILIPDYSGSGFNLSATKTYFFSGGHWRLVGPNSLVDVHDDDPLPNPGYFTVRNAGTGTTLTLLGSVLTKKATVPLLTRTDKQVDNFVSVIRPVDVKLNDLGLITSGAFRSSPNAVNRIDQLLVFDPAQVSQAKSSSATYFYSGGIWRKVGPDATDKGNDIIPAGAGFIIRKGTTVDGAPAYWQNAPTY